MRRRRFLAALGATAPLAGCVSAPRAGGTVEGDLSSVDLPVSRRELVRGAPKDAIPAITDPAFAQDWSGVSVEVYDVEWDRQLTIEPRIRPDDVVLGVTRGGAARAYPLRLLAWHEVVNDDFGGPLLVTYCPLCATGVVADRYVDGEPTVFGVSGLLYRSNLVMYDERTGSLWSQLLAQAIRGSSTGDRLSLRSSTLATWRDWQSEYPETVVLRPPPESNTVAGRDQVRNYSVDPYAGYAESDAVGVSDRTADGRLHPKTLVVGVAEGGSSRAYPLPAVRSAGSVVNDVVGDLPVVVVATGETVRAFVRRVDGETLRFASGQDGRVRAGGSRWEVTSGRALDGPFAGTTLRTAGERPAMYWFSWADLHPQTDVYDGG